MHLTKFILAIMLFTAIPFCISFSYSIVTGTIIGQPNSQQYILIDITNKGAGGILTYDNQGIRLSNCIAPGSTVRISVPIYLQKGQNTRSIPIKFVDFWNILQGDICNQLSSKEYTSAYPLKYSEQTNQFSVTTYSGCQYNAPSCDSNHNCLNNECILKPGCQYNNPSCDENHYCQNNQCLLKPGCKYNNPPCQQGYICENNNCIAIITAMEQQNIYSKLNYVENRLLSIENKVKQLRGTYEKLGNVEKLQYLNLIDSFITETRMRLSEIKSNIVIGQKKSLVFPQISNALGSLENKRASLRGQNPSSISIDTTKYLVTAPKITDQTQVTRETTPTPIVSQPTQQTTQISLNAVQSLVNNFPELKNIDNGRTITIAIFSNDGKTRNYYVEKNSGGLYVVEKNIDTDIAISMDESIFLELSSSGSKCSTLKTQTDLGNINAVALTDTERLKGFCKLKACISSNAVPEISACLW